MKTELSVQGGVFRICTAGADHARLHVAVSGAAGEVPVAVQAVDLWGTPAWKAAGH